MRVWAMGTAGALLAGMVQMPSTPPVRLGLWESTSSLTLTMAGANVPARPPIVTRSRSCVTVATWTKALTSFGRASACLRNNEMYAAGRLSFDLACPNQNGRGHGAMQFSSDTGHGTIHLEINAAGHQVISDMTIASKFVSASCGAVAPGTPQVVK